MCGIWAFLNKQKLSTEYLGKLYQYYNEITPRGPERSKLINLHLLNDLNVMLGFHRLSIIDTSHRGDQPFVIHLEKENRTINKSMLIDLLFFYNERVFIIKKQCMLISYNQLK